MNVEISVFVRNELEYLGFKITREGIMPFSYKEEALKNIAVNTIKKHMQSFIGLPITTEVCGNIDLLF